jgi:hypothetical protein
MKTYALMWLGGESPGSCTTCGVNPRDDVITYADVSDPAHSDFVGNVDNNMASSARHRIVYLPILWRYFQEHFTQYAY